MAFVLSLTTLWIVGLFLVLYYWCAENSKTRGADNTDRWNTGFQENSNDKYKQNSASSLESSEASEGEEFTNIDTRKRLKYQTKTRWPSRTSFSSS